MRALAVNIKRGRPGKVGYFDGRPKWRPSERRLTRNQGQEMPLEGEAKFESLPHITFEDVLVLGPVWFGRQEQAVGSPELERGPRREAAQALCNAPR